MESTDHFRTVSADTSGEVSAPGGEQILPNPGPAPQGPAHGASSESGDARLAQTLQQHQDGAGGNTGSSGEELVGGVAGAAGEAGAPHGGAGSSSSSGSSGSGAGATGGGPFVKFTDAKALFAEVKVKCSTLSELTSKCLTSQQYEPRAVMVVFELEKLVEQFNDQAVVPEGSEVRRDAFGLFMDTGKVLQSKAKDSSAEPGLRRSAENTGIRLGRMALDVYPPARDALLQQGVQFSASASQLAEASDRQHVVASR